MSVPSFFEIISVLAPLFSVASVLMGPPTGCCFFSFCWQLFLVPCSSLALFTRFTRLVKKKIYIYIVGGRCRKKRSFCQEMLNFFYLTSFWQNDLRGQIVKADLSRRSPM